LEVFLEQSQPQDLGQAQLPAEEKVNWKQFTWDLLETIILAVVLYFGINAVSARVRVDGFSMRPTLDDGEFVLVNRLAYTFGKMERGDIIVFYYPSDPNQELIKRIIGLPGDQIVVQRGQVSVNGHLLNEPYIAALPNYSGEWTVPEDKLFVLGDNRNDSSDSHSWGMLPTKNVVGKSILIYWPPGLWKVIQHADVVAAAP
jgi:signal peptidase I